MTIYVLCRVHVPVEPTVMSLHPSLRHLALKIKNPFMKLDILAVYHEFTDTFQFWFEHTVQYKTVYLIVQCLVTRLGKYLQY